MISAARILCDGFLRKFGRLNGHYKQLERLTGERHFLPALINFLIYILYAFLVECLYSGGNLYQHLC